MAVRKREGHRGWGGGGRERERKRERESHGLDNWINGVLLLCNMFQYLTVLCLAYGLTAAGCVYGFVYREEVSVHL